MRPNIFDYCDLAEYLKVYAETKRKSSPYWSLGVWQRALGLKGRGTLTNLLSRKRGLAPHLADRLKANLRLTEIESHYFDLLAKASSPQLDAESRADIRRRLAEASAGRDYRELSDEDFDLISHPLAFVLREAVKLDGFSPDPEWVRNRLKAIRATYEEIEETYRKLVEVELLQWSDGKLIQCERHYETRWDRPLESMKRYYEKSLALNEKAIRAIDPSERHYSSITFSCLPEDLPALREHLNEFARRTLEGYDRACDARQVYQLHVQLVPHVDVQLSQGI